MCCRAGAGTRQTSFFDGPSWGYVKLSCCLWVGVNFRQDQNVVTPGGAHTSAAVLTAGRRQVICRSGHPLSLKMPPGPASCHSPPPWHLVIYPLGVICSPHESTHSMQAGTYCPIPQHQHGSWVFSKRSAKSCSPYRCMLGMPWCVVIQSPVGKKDAEAAIT